jgi:putative ABC transport system permease protein
MGYARGFFFSVVVEEALILGLFGFIPGSLVGTALLMLMGKLTTLPLTMTPGMIVSVFTGTVVFSTLSGAVATRKLAAADPAELF